MAKTKKIKKEQLDVINDQQKNLNTLLTNIGLIESQKHGFLHQIAELNKSIEDFKSELFKEYGNVNINVSDGSYVDIEEKVEE